MILLLLMLAAAGAVEQADMTVVVLRRFAWQGPGRLLAGHPALPRL